MDSKLLADMVEVEFGRARADVQRATSFARGIAWTSNPRISRSRGVRADNALFADANISAAKGSRKGTHTPTITQKY